MKIETSIKPRKDGTVRVGVDKDTYVFKADESGVLVADVENEAHISFLLGRGDDFLPADEADFAAADALIAAGNPSGDDDEGDAPDDDDEDQDPNAAPIEEPASVVAAVAANRGGRKKK